MKLYKYLNARYALEALESRMLKVTTIWDANDPDEWLPCMIDPDTGTDFHDNPMLRNEFRWVWSHRCGFVSLSSLMDSNAMWGLYADKFRGAVLSFSVLDQGKMIHVNYSSKRLKMDKVYIVNLTEEKLREFVATKGKDWEYESEWRYLVSIEQCQTKQTGLETIHLSEWEPGLRLDGIYLGPECTITYSDVVIRLRRRTDDVFFIERLKHSSELYELETKDRKTWTGDCLVPA